MKFKDILLGVLRLIVIPSVVLLLTALGLKVYEVASNYLENRTKGEVSTVEEVQELVGEPGTFRVPLACPIQPTAG